MKHCEDCQKLFDEKEGYELEAQRGSLVQAHQQARGLPLSKDLKKWTAVKEKLESTCSQYKNTRPSTCEPFAFDDDMMKHCEDCQKLFDEKEGYELEAQRGSLVQVQAHQQDALAVMKKLLEENKALKARVAELEGASAHGGGTCCAMWTGGKASELQSEVLDWCVTQTSCAKNAENPWDSYGSKVTDVVDVPDQTTCKKKRAPACPL